MTITQEDRDAAANSLDPNIDPHQIHTLRKGGDTRLASAFARHREAAYAAGGDNRQAKIVAWLRAGGLYADWDTSMNVRFLLRLKSAWLSFRRPWVFAKAGQRFAADAIEAGERLR